MRSVTSSGRSSTSSPENEHHALTRHPAYGKSRDIRRRAIHPGCAGSFRINHSFYEVYDKHMSFLQRKTKFTVKTFIGISSIFVALLMISEFFVKLSVPTRPALDQSAALVTFMPKAAVPTLTVIIIDTILMAALLVFFAALRQLVSRERPHHRWIADLAFSAGIVFVAITLVGDSMDAGSALDAFKHTPDASVIRALTEGHIFIFGSIGAVMIALITTCFAYITLATKVVPRWTGHLAYIVAILNLAIVPTAFGGTDATNFFSAGGLAVTVLSIFPLLVWVISIGIVTIRNQRMHPGGILRP